MEADGRDPRRLERRDLDSGLALVVQAAPAGSASFSASYVGPAGSGYDPPGREGLALLTAELAVCGAGRLDRRALARELDRAGATLASELHPEAVAITLWGPSGAADRLFPLLADAIATPRFEPTELARLRRQVIERQLRERVQPDRRSERELGRRLFPPGHPYRGTGLGRAASIRSIGSGDLRRFHRHHFTARGGALVVTGPWSASAVMRRFGRSFAAVSAAPAPGPLDATTSRRSGGPPTRVIVPGGSQVEIRAGGAALRRASEQYPAAFLANELLGGRAMLSHLFRELRERRGLVYHTSSALAALRSGGYWTAGAGTEPKRVDEVTRRLHGELRRLREQPTSPTELDRVRESAIGAITLELERSSTAHEIALEAAQFELSAEYFTTWPAVLRAVRPREVRRVAEELFAPERTVTVQVGPAGNSVG
jgi:zinc protease